MERNHTKYIDRLASATSLNSNLILGVRPLERNIRADLSEFGFRDQRELKSMRAFRAILYWGVFFFLACVSLQAQAKPAEANQASCQNFVQRFYDWYVPKALDINTDAFSLAMDKSRSSFSPELVQQVKDARAEAWRRQEVFLDFDPILNTQDPSGRHYEIQNVTSKDGRCQAGVSGLYHHSNIKKRAKPDVVAELVMENDHWIFVDFHYPDSHHPDNESLVRMLKRILKAGGR
jgi:hypothetical protein